MSKLEEFLMQNELNTEETMEVKVSERIPLPFKIRAISEAENKAIKKSCQTVTFDKRTHQKVIDTNYDLYLTRLVIACCVEPNFKNAELQAKYGLWVPKHWSISCCALVNIISYLKRSRRSMDSTQTSTPWLKKQKTNSGGRW
ncbi:phage tail assembly chaperone [Acetivibrio straminisolvens]|uniref:phage tail assembly chaperone n=1 Tax=Acetivibrio straminisolvens TaxID=253314 RepID=UPI0006D11D2B